MITSAKWQNIAGSKNFFRPDGFEFIREAGLLS